MKLLYIFFGFKCSFLASVLPALSQAVAYNDARQFSGDVQVINQWSAERTDIGDCQTARLGDPYYHDTSPKSNSWDGKKDPNQDYVRAEDLCGARFDDLSGVYESGSLRYIVTHDPRGGRVEIRYLYVKPEDEPRKTWNIGIGWTVAEGRIHADDMWLNVWGVFPPHTKKSCPNQYITKRRAAYLGLGYFAIT